MIVNLRDEHSLRALFYLSLEVAEQDKIVGLYSGAWDMCHYFHRQSIEQAKRMCDFLIIGIGTDRLVRENKGIDRPIFSEQQRLYMIDTLKAVDACFLMDSETEYAVVAKELMSEKYNGVTFKPEEWKNKLEIIPGYNSEASYLPSLYRKKGINVEQYRFGNVVIIPHMSFNDSTTKTIATLLEKKK